MKNSGIIKRALALWIDSMMIGLLIQYVGKVEILEQMGQISEGGAMSVVFNWTSILLMAAVGAYEVICIASPLSSTLGKKMVGLIVVTEDGQKPSIIQSAIRAFVKSLTFLNWLSFIMILFKKRALHDAMSGLSTVTKSSLNNMAPAFEERGM